MSQKEEFVHELTELILGAPCGRRLGFRALCFGKARGRTFSDGELAELLEDVEAECVKRGVTLDFSEWDGLCVGPRHNQSFVVRKSALYYVRRALRGL